MITEVKRSSEFPLVCLQDSVIYERMAKGGDNPIARDTARHMEHFAVDGLRTLCIAERELQETSYEVRILPGTALPMRPASWMCWQLCVYICRSGASGIIKLASLSPTERRSWIGWQRR